MLIIQFTWRASPCRPAEFQAAWSMTCVFVFSFILSLSFMSSTNLPLSAVASERWIQLSQRLGFCHLCVDDVQLIWSLWDIFFIWMLPVGPGVLKPNGHGPVLNQPPFRVWLMLHSDATLVWSVNNRPFHMSSVENIKSWSLCFLC